MKDIKDKHLIKTESDGMLNGILTLLKKYGVAPTLLFAGIIFFIFEFWPFIKKEIWPMIKAHVEENREIRKQQTEILQKIQIQMDELLKLKRLEIKNKTQTRSLLDRFLTPNIRQAWTTIATKKFNYVSN